MLKALIFDLDGVIVDSHPVHKRAWKAFFASRRKNFSDEELEFVVEGKKREDILRHFLGELTDQQIKDYGAEKDALFRGSAAEFRPVAGVERFLSEISAAGLSAALASSASRGRVGYMLQQLRLAEHFKVIVTGDDVTVGKPDPKIFQLAAAQIGIQPHNILVCEDAVNGIQAAKLAGMKCLAIAANGRGPVLRDAGADKIVPDFTEARLEELRLLFHQ